jgi:hypothetical protein
MSRSLVAFKSMAVVILPDIVDSVQQGCAWKGGRAACRAGDVVAFHGDLVAFADHFEGPVVVAVAAAGGVRGLAVYVVV